MTTNGSKVEGSALMIINRQWIHVEIYDQTQHVPLHKPDVEGYDLHILHSLDYIQTH